MVIGSKSNTRGIYTKFVEYIAINLAVMYRKEAWKLLR
jgi:hypothetical protein